VDRHEEAVGTAYLPITSGKTSDPGKVRELNEDYIVAMQLGGGEEEPGRLRYAAAIADGMGGHNAGEIASRTAADTFLDSIQGSSWPPSTGSAEDAVVRAFRAANEAVLACGRSSPENEGMGTTLTALVVLGDEVHLAHVGDTRAYLVRDGSVRQLTRDDSWVADQVESGVMTEEEAGSSQHRNLLTRALGTKADVPIRTYREALKEGDFLVLTTDGLHNGLSATEIGDAVRHTPNPQDACEQLVILARERDGSDNISVVCLTFGDNARKSPTRRLPRAGGAPRRRRPFVLLMLLLLVVLASIAVVARGLVPVKSDAPASQESPVTGTAAVSSQPLADGESAGHTASADH